jgi:hypothetical protein
MALQELGNYTEADESLHRALALNLKAARAEEAKKVLASKGAK